MSKRFLGFGLGVALAVAGALAIQWSPGPAAADVSAGRVVDQVYFRVNTLRPHSRAPMDAIARLAALEDEVTVVVIGHASRDELAPRTLSVDRTRSVVDYLVARGVPRSRIRAIPRGCDQPNAVAGSANPERNARVELRIDDRT